MYFQTATPSSYSKEKKKSGIHFVTIMHLIFSSTNNYDTMNPMKISLDTIAERTQ